MTIFLSALFKNSLLVQAQSRAKQPSFVTIKISFGRKCPSNFSSSEQGVQKHLPGNALL
ncbi:MAG: hypothetical protein V3U57_03660 [Robiginitomaculum sp.]